MASSPGEARRMSGRERPRGETRRWVARGARAHERRDVLARRRDRRLKLRAGQAAKHPHDGALDRLLYLGRSRLRKVLHELGRGDVDELVVVPVLFDRPLQLATLLLPVAVAPPTRAAKQLVEDAHANVERARRRARAHRRGGRAEHGARGDDAAAWRHEPRAHRPGWRERERERDERSHQRAPSTGSGWARVPKLLHQHG